MYLIRLSIKIHHKSNKNNIQYIRRENFKCYPPLPLNIFLATSLLFGIFIIFQKLQCYCFVQLGVSCVFSIQKQYWLFGKNSVIRAQFNAQHVISKNIWKKKRLKLYFYWIVFRISPRISYCTHYVTWAGTTKSGDYATNIRIKCHTRRIYL